METKPVDPSANHDDPLAGPTYIVGFVGTVILVAIVFLIQVVVYDSKDRIGAKVRTKEFLEIGEVRELHRGQLESYGWSYPEEDRVRVPVQSGVERVLERYGSGAGQ
jgi:hypothetical protein